MTYFILVLVVAAVIIFGVASLMDKRRKSMNTITQLPLGAVSKILLWLSRGMLVITMLALIGSFALNQILYARLAWGFLSAYILLGFGFQITRRKSI